MLLASCAKTAYRSRYPFSKLDWTYATCAAVHPFRRKQRGDCLHGCPCVQVDAAWAHLQRLIQLSCIFSLVYAGLTQPGDMGSFLIKLFTSNIAVEKRTRSNNT